MKEKKCKTCGDYKTLDNFNKRSSSKDKLEYSCKICMCVVGKTYYNKYKKKVLKRTAEYYKNHKKEKAISGKIYEFKNKDKRAKQRRKRERDRRINDPLWRLVKIIRNLTYNSLIRKGYSKNTKTFEIIGLLKEDLLIYLNNNKYGFKFEDGLYDLDHIIATATAKTEQELLRLCHYKNLQLLPSEYNRRVKSDSDWNQTHFENWLLKNPQNSAL